MIYDDVSSPSSLLVQTVARPKRVAFLFDQDKATLAEIDEAILAATECWGGAYWPLVPFGPDGITAGWWTVLEAVDPDIVCVLHELPAELTAQVIRQCAPMRILQSPRDPAQRRGHGLVDRHRIGALSISQMPRIIHAGQRLQPTHVQFLIFEDKGSDSPNRAFALRNFGLLSNDIRFTQSFDDLNHQWMDPGKNTPTQLFTDFALGQSVTPRDMARYGAERPFEPTATAEAGAFWLVVGDTPADVSLAWNSVTLQRSHLGKSCLWLSNAEASNQGSLAEAGRWLSQRFYATQGSNQGFVLSYSEDLNFLKTVAQGVKSSIRLTPRVLERTQSSFGGSQRPRTPSTSARAQQVPVRKEGGLAEFARPEFAPPGRNEGGWMVDLAIEHPRDPSIISSLSMWKVPRRAGVAECFGGQQHARISWERMPGIEVSGSDTDVWFRIPEPRAVFEACLLKSVLSPSGEVEPQRPHAYVLSPSAAGLQLRGVLGLFGGLWQTGHAFENPFWRDLLTELAGHPEDRRARQVKAIADVLAEPEARNMDLARLSERIAEKAWRAETTTPRVALDSLRKRFPEHVRRSEKASPQQSSFRPNEKFDESAHDDLENLIERGVLLQGVEVRCPECLTKLWRHVDDLRRSGPCPGCLASVQLPPNPPWSAQANELVSGALRHRGILPVIHALYALQGRAHAKTFTFISSQDVVPYPEGDVVTDLDLVALLDGELLIGEVKTNARGFDEKTVRTMVEIAKVMLPDVLMFVAEDDGNDWPSDVKSLLERAVADLAEHGVKVQRELLRWPS